MGEIEPDGQYLPDDAEHGTQVDAPKVFEYLPAAHSVQLLDEAEDENDPAEHERQAEAVEAPVAAEYEPATQLVHALDTEESEYWPAAHSVQLLDEAEDENDPAEHERQTEAVEAPVAAEYVPATQLVHALAPEEGEYLPATHSVQAVAPGSCDLFPTGHFEHGVPAGYVLETSALNVPGLHFWHEPTWPS